MFQNLLMLAGLGGVMVPLVLHLLARSRCRSVDWGATLFLPQSRPDQRRVARLREHGLLLLRMTMIALLALAMARPVLDGGSGWVAEESGATAVLVVDCSGSMGYDEFGRTRMEAARDVALQILAGLRKGDSVALLTAGGEKADELAEPTVNHQAVAARVARLRASRGRADVGGALRRAAEIFEKSGAANRELYLVCDRQAANWDDAAGDPSGEVRRRLEGNGRFRGVVVPVGASGADNVAVESVEVHRPPLIRGQPNELLVRVRNDGPVPRSNLMLMCSWDGQFHSAAVHVGADSSATVKVPVNAERVGPHVFAAELQSSGLTEDDRLQATFDAVEPIRVLAVSDGGAQPSPDDAYFIKAALMPFAGSGSEVSDLAAVEVVPAEQWNPAAADAYQVLILSNVASLSAERIRAVETFVARGGSVLVALGDRVDSEQYNRLLHRDGAGFLPAELDGAVASERHVAVIESDAGGPLSNVLRELSVAARTVRVRQYVRVRPSEAGSRVPARYDNGDPFLVESEFGHGRVVLMTTALDGSWSNLPATPLFLPALHSVVADLARMPPGQAVDLAPVESELDVLDGDSLAQRVEERGLELLEVDQATRAEFVAERGTDRPWALLLGAVLLLAAVEAGITRVLAGGGSP